MGDEEMSLMRRKALAPIAFPCGDGPFSTLILGCRVHESGFVELTGFLRMPYSNRPKVGGGWAIPYRALNVNSRVMTREAVKVALTPRVYGRKKPVPKAHKRRQIYINPERIAESRPQSGANGDQDNQCLRTKPQPRSRPRAASPASPPVPLTLWPLRTWKTPRAASCGI